MSRIGWAQIPTFRMCATIHVNQTETMSPADIENDHTLYFGQFNDLDPIGGSDLSWTGVRFTPSVGRIPFVVGSPIFEQRPRPGLKRDLLDLAVVGQRVCRLDINHEFSAAPD